MDLADILEKMGSLMLFIGPVAVAELVLLARARWRRRQSSQEELEGIQDHPWKA